MLACQAYSECTQYGELPHVMQQAAVSVGNISFRRQHLRSWQDQRVYV